MTDQQLQVEILSELACEPELHPERIGVSVEGGVVTLSGHVDNYRQNLTVERVVKRVFSAKGVVDDLEVRLPSRDEVPDDELAREAVQAISELSEVPPDTVRVTVRDGRVTLEGKLERPELATQVHWAVRYLRGVRAILDHLEIERELAAT
jgi:osmotically-inducible protein OsmY